MYDPLHFNKDGTPVDMSHIKNIDTGKQNPSEMYRKNLAEQIKATGKYIMEHPEDFIKNFDAIQKLTIILEFPSLDDKVSTCPTIITTQQNINIEAVKILQNRGSDDE